MFNTSSFKMFIVMALVVAMLPLTVMIGVGSTEKSQAKLVMSAGAKSATLTLQAMAQPNSWKALPFFMTIKAELGNGFSGSLFPPLATTPTGCRMIPDTMTMCDTIEIPRMFADLLDTVTGARINQKSVVSAYIEEADQFSLPHQARFNFTDWQCSRDGAPLDKGVDFIVEGGSAIWGQLFLPKISGNTVCTAIYKQQSTRLRVRGFSP